jgi:hypothetical protein
MKNTKKEKNELGSKRIENSGYFIRGGDILNNAAAFVNDPFVVKSTYSGQQLRRDKTAGQRRQNTENRRQKSMSMCKSVNMNFQAPC